MNGLDSIRQTVVDSLEVAIADVMPAMEEDERHHTAEEYFNDLSGEEIVAMFEEVTH